MTTSQWDESPESRSGFPVWRCPPKGHVNDMLRAACKQCGAHRPCEHWDGERHCGAVPVHMYICGPRCNPHAPGALRTFRETSPNRTETEREAA